MVNTTKESDSQRILSGRTRTITDKDAILQNGRWNVQSTTACTLFAQVIPHNLLYKWLRHLSSGIMKQSCMLLEPGRWKSCPRAT